MRPSIVKLLGSAGLLGLVAVTAGATAAAAQSAPPEPLPLEPVAFPTFEERVLSNGADLIVVGQPEQPFVTVNLVVKAGTSADPRNRVGLATMVAALLDKGTTTRSALEIAEAIDFLGATLSAGPSADWTSVTLGTVTPNLDAALEIMADVVIDPAFPEDELELLRTQTLTALQFQLSQAGALADRAFTEAVFGNHPYGKVPTPESIESISQAHVQRFHRTYFRPTNALFVVAGDVDADDIAASLERRFAGWEPGPVSPPSYFAPPTREANEVILVHKPGSVQSVIRVGHVLPTGNAPEWDALALGTRVLGGGSNGRLFQILREEKGWTYGAYARATRRKDAGVLTLTAEVRNEVTDSSVAELLLQLGRMGAEPVAPEDLRLHQDYLTGSFPLGIETPQQIAGQVAENRLLGLPPEELETYRQRIAALGPGDVQDVARSHVRGDGLVIVVVGDATQVRQGLTRFGSVRMMDVEGNRIALEDIEVRESDVAWDTSILAPGNWTYQVSFQGQPVGELNRALIRADVDGSAGLTFRSNMVTPGQTMTQEVTFVARSFRPTSSKLEVTAGGQSFGSDLEIRGGRVVGSRRAPGRDAEAIDREVVEGAVLGEMQELAVWLADLESGEDLVFPAVSAQSGGVDNVKIEVKGKTEITVPAGTFEAYELELSGGGATQRAYARVERPHILLKLEPVGQPVVIELKSATGG